MKKIILFLLAGMILGACNQMKNTENNNIPVYEGNDLGVIWNPGFTTFRIYSPDATQARVNLYEKGHGGKVQETIPMEKSDKGTWFLKKRGDLHGIYYTFQIKYNDIWLNETPGIYARAVGVNGKRGMITDFARTDPNGWAMDKSPDLKSKNDVILYELHIRDFSIAPNSGMQHKGKFLAFTEENTQNSFGDITGLSYIADLGVTHVHLLPCFDFRSIDESVESDDYNWGYDPQNYNAPEGSYSTNPFEAEVRIKEFKEMVMAFHKHGLRVVMDVVYNHTGDTENSNFNLLAPGYYYRKNSDGSWSNASACGNETASEKPMMRKFMTESLLWWMEEYHIDGFRFDLMGIHDIETMNIISEALHEKNPSVIIYGEGWNAGATPMPDSLLALKKNTAKMDRVAAFSDDFRDAIKGHWSSATDSGFVSGARGMEESVKFGIAASCYHPQINYQKVNYSDAPWSDDPAQTISYVTCHDNHTLFDKISASVPGAAEEEIIAMHKLAAGMVLTSQGIPFFHAGMEFLRTKMGEHNSYQSPDSINQIDWDLITENQQVVDYINDLLEFRKAHPALKMESEELICEHLTFLPVKNGVVGFRIDGKAVGDPYQELVVIYNALEKEYLFEPGSAYFIAMDQNGPKWETSTLRRIFHVPPKSMMILGKL
jgi:pullulanase